MFVDVGGPTLLRIPEDGAFADPNDAYPAVIEDQRHAYQVTTVEEVRAFQDAWLAGESPPHPRPRPAIPRTHDERSVIPRINASRWIADCPCGAANAVWDQNPEMVCLSCGHACKVAWQLPSLRAEVIRVIADWPTERRSWDAHLGETVDELRIQAVLMTGVAPDLRNGLLVARGVSMPDDLVAPQEYLDRLVAERKKRRT